MFRSLLAAWLIEPQPYHAPPPPIATPEPKPGHESLQEFESRVLPSMMSPDHSQSQNQPSQAKLPSPPSQQSTAGANLFDEECPWCTAMKAGPCGREFRRWQQCLKDVKAENEQRAHSSLSYLTLTESQRQSTEQKQYARVCFDNFRRLHTCVHANPRHKAYYRQLIKIKDDEEDQDEIDGDDDDFDAADMPDEEDDD